MERRGEGPRRVERPGPRALEVESVREDEHREGVDGVGREDIGDEPFGRLPHEGVDSLPRLLMLREEVNGLRDRGVTQRGGVRELRREVPVAVDPDAAGERRRLCDVAEPSHQRDRRAAVELVERP